jgi:hypothetical protein
LSNAPSEDRIAARLVMIERDQAIMNQALGLMVDVLKQQTDLLVEIAAAVRHEPGPSPTVRALDELTEAVVRMGAGVEVMHQKLDALPEAIGAVLDGGEPPGPGSHDADKQKGT